VTAHDDQLGAALQGRYTIERELGSGGMATVYLAEDVKHNRKVAVKVLRPELAAVLGVARFLKEIEVTANLNHPHILPLYDSGAGDGFLYYVMPFVKGESLRDRLNREQQLPVEAALKIASEVAAGAGEVRTGSATGVCGPRAQGPWASGSLRGGDGPGSHLVCHAAGEQPGWQHALRSRQSVLLRRALV
jgi:serine/threonine protein kinase